MVGPYCPRNKPGGSKSVEPKIKIKKVRKKKKKRDLKRKSMMKKNNNMNDLKV